MSNSFFQKLTFILSSSTNRKQLCFLALAFLALLASLVELPLPVNAGWLTILLCGVPIIWNALAAVIKEHNIKADLLVSIALLASIYIGEIFAAAEISFIMQLGAFLEEITVYQAQSDIQKLINLTPQTARRLFNGEEHLIPAEFVHINDIIKVLPGETIPVDGTIISGQSTVDQAIMTGESLPVDKQIGDSVYSGTINQFGSFILRATKAGADSSMQRMVNLVKNTKPETAKIVGLADKWATYIVIMALFTACTTFFVTKEISRAVTILVVFCPCALVLATPTAIIAAIGNATRHGFLVRQGDALERLAQVRQFVFDKTGTLTFGKLQVTTIQSFTQQYNSDQLYQLVASAEAQSEHPLGKAIINNYKDKNKGELLQADTTITLPGKGLKASINHTVFYFGNTKLLTQANLSLTPAQTAIVDTYLQQGSTIIYIANKSEVLGFIALADTIRPQSSSMIKRLHSLKLTTAMLTGDTAAAACNIVKITHIDKLQANCLPEDKLNYIKTQQAQANYLCMLGDGINDAPALKQAYVGIAMGGIGSDIALEAADIILTKDNIEALPQLFLLSKKMLQTIKLNLTFSLLLNIIAILLAITGVLNPVVGALVHNAGSLLVILNAALLFKWQSKHVATEKTIINEKSYALQ